MIGTKTARDYRFFRAHAGGWVGHNAQGALALVHAERAAEILGWAYGWFGDDDADLGDHAIWCPDERREQAGYQRDGSNCPRFNPSFLVAHAHYAYVCILKDARGEVLESLGGVIDPDDAYRRVIEAELASEAIGNIATYQVA
jgi:hypothetical protein